MISLACHEESTGLMVEVASLGLRSNFPLGTLKVGLCRGSLRNSVFFFVLFVTGIVECMITFQYLLSQVIQIRLGDKIFFCRHDIKAEGY